MQTSELEQVDIHISVVTGGRWKGETEIEETTPRVSVVSP